MFSSSSYLRPLAFLALTAACGEPTAPLEPPADAAGPPRIEVTVITAVPRTMLQIHDRDGRPVGGVAADLDGVTTLSVPVDAAITAPAQHAFSLDYATTVVGVVDGDRIDFTGGPRASQAAPVGSARIRIAGVPAATRVSTFSPCGAGQSDESTSDHVHELFAATCAGPLLAFAGTLPWSYAVRSAELTHNGSILIEGPWREVPRRTVVLTGVPDGAYHSTTPMVADTGVIRIGSELTPVDGRSDATVLYFPEIVDPIEEEVAARGPTGERTARWTRSAAELALPVPERDIDLLPIIQVRRDGDAVSWTIPGGAPGALVRIHAGGWAFVVDPARGGFTLPAGMLGSGPISAELIAVQGLDWTHARSHPSEDFVYGYPEARTSSARSE